MRWLAWRWHTTWAAVPSSCLTVGLLKKATRALSVVAGTGSMTQETAVDAEDASESVRSTQTEVRVRRKVPLYRLVWFGSAVGWNCWLPLAA